MDIEIKISKNEIVRTTIIEPIKEVTMTALLASLKSVKQQSNDTMTNLVNADKNCSGTINSPSKRKDQDDDEDNNSEEDIRDSEDDHSIKKIRSEENEPA